MNLEKTYCIKSLNKEGKYFTQYIEANNINEATEKAKDSYFFLANDLQATSISSNKVSKTTLLKGKLRFNFNAGWTILEVTGLTIFQALEEAQDFELTKGEEIEEITS